MIPLPAFARAVPTYNLHLTLHFIGNVQLQQMDCLRHQARGVSASAFELMLDNSGCFGKAKVAWLGCRKVPAELRELHQKLGSVLGSCDYQPEARAYNPHVTVARKTGELPKAEAIEPIRWKVDQFTLINSRSTSQGVKYEVVETYDLK